MLRNPSIPWVFLGGLLAVLAASCSPPQQDGVRRSLQIVVLGSSTAEGVGPGEPDSAWVPRYRAWLAANDTSNRVVNLARGGYTTYHMMPDDFVPRGERPTPDLERNITRALALGPDAIIINLPSNDAAYGYAVEEQLANYDTILAHASAAGVPVWISTTQPRNLGPERAALIAMRDSTFDRFGARAIDFWTGLAEADGRIAPRYDCGDGIHLNDAAHGILAERVREAGIPNAVGRGGLP